MCAHSDVHKCTHIHRHVHVTVHVESRGQLLGVCFLLSPYEIRDETQVVQALHYYIQVAVGVAGVAWWEVSCVSQLLPEFHPQHCKQ